MWHSHSVTNHDSPTLQLDDTDSTCAVSVVRCILILPVLYQWWDVPVFFWSWKRCQPLTLDLGPVDVELFTCRLQGLSSAWPSSSCPLKNSLTPLVHPWSCPSVASSHTHTHTHTVISVLCVDGQHCCYFSASLSIKLLGGRTELILVNPRNQRLGYCGSNCPPHPPSSPLLQHHPSHPPIANWQGRP